jgi:hypothetical protein
MIQEEIRPIEWPEGPASSPEMSLPWWAKLAAIATGVSTTVMAIAAVIALFR